MNYSLLEAAATSSTKAPIMPVRSLTASILASLTTWLLVTDPVTVSNAISTGDAEVLLRVIGTALVDIFRILIGYL